MKNLEGLFEHFLKDIYYAEQQILKTLPKMADKADSSDLRDAFEHHKSETEDQIENLKKVFDTCGIKVEGKKCEAIEGILKEGEDIMSEADEGDTRDAGMIAAAQAVEHYEITRYGTLVSWARQLGKDDCADLLQENLDQEYSADEKLDKLAENRLNRQAA
ncbi:MAG: ferritin-like domain-containing protein [Silicimonas sp.]|nr:ferritin-like domain-containing protein [Silicimonas sp.]